MTATRKLSHFRQLSLSCETPPSAQRRKSLKKQFSEDIPDLKNSWFNGGNEIRVSLNSKIKKDPADRPPPIKIAWGDTKSHDVRSEDAVIIKKYKEINRPPSRKLTRHGSLEKDSILYSKQDLTEKLRHYNTEMEKDEKPNLKIFLAHNPRDNMDSEYHISQTEVTNQYLERTYNDSNKPKFKQPLISTLGENNNFQIKKSKGRVPNEPLCSPKTQTDNSRPLFTRSNTVVVVPLVEAENKIENNTAPNKEVNIETPEINIIIRPATAASRREKFQKRTNSAFYSTVKEPVINNNTNSNFRPPLIRSSSAPASRTEKGKFFATKRKIKGSKRSHSKSRESSKQGFDEIEWKNASPHSNEIETMVSLVSPSGSDNEEATEDEKEREREKPRPVLKQPPPTSQGDKTARKEDGTKEPLKSLTLRKAVKSVTFQQSSIHAIRSFSASFPARRGSMATTLALGHGDKTNSATSPKTHEKRATNSNTPDADERVPKRRLLRSNTTDSSKNSSIDQPDDVHNDEQKQTTKSEMENMKITVEIQSKSNTEHKNYNVDNTEKQTKAEENKELQKMASFDKPESTTNEVEDLPQYKTEKEKQCWDMYCKMTTKGIAVSYDTILRGMLTPTEYRLRRKSSIAEEMKLQMVNDKKMTEMQSVKKEEKNK